MSKRKRAYGDGSIFLRGKYYYLQSCVNGKTKWTSLRTSIRMEAERKAAELRPIVDADTKEKVAVFVAEARHLSKTGKVKLSEAWEKFFKTRPNVSPGTLGNHKLHWARFFKWMEMNRPNVKSLGQIDLETAKEYMNAFAALGVHSDTFNKQKISLAKIWDALSDEAGLRKADNPFREIESRKDESFSRENLSEEELLLVLRTLDDPPFHLLNALEVRVLFTLGAFAGMRLGDCTLLKWKNVDRQRGIIAFVPRKTARRVGRLVKIPIHPELERQLVFASEWEVDEYVLPKTAERYQRNPAGVKQDIVRVFEKCGFKTSEKLPGRLQARSIYGFHSLRHTFVSICANRGVPLAMVQELVGHGNPAITRHYFHSDENAARKAIAALPSLAPAANGNPVLQSMGTEDPALAAPQGKREALIADIGKALPVADDGKLAQISKLLALDA